MCVRDAIESVGFFFDIGRFDRANYLTVIFRFSTAGLELIERDVSPCFIRN